MILMYFYFASGLSKSILRNYDKLNDFLGLSFLQSAYLYLWSQAEHCILRLSSMSCLMTSYLLRQTYEQKTDTNIPEYIQIVKTVTKVMKNMMLMGFDLAVTIVDS
jgi:hypothetical protein